jgi:hypothetical protein
VSVNGYITSAQIATPGSTYVIAPTVQIKCTNGNNGLLNTLVGFAASSAPYNMQIVAGTAITVAAGVSVTISVEIAAQSNSYQATTSNLDLRIEVIKK